MLKAFAHCHAEVFNNRSIFFLNHSLFNPLMIVSLKMLRQNLFQSSRE